MGGGGFSWQPYLISHLGGLLLATGHAAEWYAMQLDHYDRNYLDRDRVFNQDHNPHSKQTVYPSTDPTANLTYCSIPVSFRNYFMMIGYHRNTATGELWLTPAIPDEMEHQMIDAFYFSPEGCGTISCVESGDGFNNTELLFRPDNPVEVTSIYIKDKGFATTYVNVNGTDLTPSPSGAGHAAELKIPWTGTVGPEGLRVLESDQPIGVLDRPATFLRGDISIECRGGVVTVGVNGRPVHRVEIVAADGALVEKASAGANGRCRIDLNKFGPGIYFIRIVSGTRVESRAITITR
jgi:hypothetical protein